MFYYRHPAVVCVIHIGGHSVFPCSRCSRMFTSPSALVRHMRIHTGQRSYVCQTCGQAFQTSSNLSRHMRIHTDERPYVCQTCGQAFQTSGNLTVHMHIHTGEQPSNQQPYVCRACGRAFCLLSNLTAHMWTQHSAMQADISDLEPTIPAHWLSESKFNALVEDLRRSPSGWSGIVE
ncbi:C2H2-type zinc finger protein [Salmonella enterica subsp. enterica serovar Anatum]|nr:C2H2-type zinc finger protein [Salmonella enterica]EBV6706527.1 C2H2-type zinc finger protein [Salmonella enterica subsp. enterica serovar Anatum]